MNRPIAFIVLLCKEDFANRTKSLSGRCAGASTECSTEHSGAGCGLEGAWRDYKVSRVKHNRPSPFYPFAGENLKGRGASMTELSELAKNEAGATAIEYGLIAALISLACIIAFTSLGLNLAGIFDTISNALR